METRSKVISMLWLDADQKKELQDKVRSAVAYFVGKYGVNPSACVINKNMLTTGDSEPDAAVVFDGIEILWSRSILLHHFLVTTDGAEWKSHG